MAVVNAEAQLERSLTDKHVYTADGSSTSSLVSLSHTQTNLTEKQLTEQCDTMTIGLVWLLEGQSKVPRVHMAALAAQGCTTEVIFRHLGDSLS